LETDEQAKDQSLSLVQIRRKLFEKDSGQLRVCGAQMCTKDGQPLTDEEKLSEANYAGDMSSEATSQHVSPKSADISEDTSPRSTEVRVGLSEDLSPISIELNDASSAKSVEVKDVLSEDGSQRSTEVKDASSEDISRESIEIKDTVSENVSPKSIDVKDTLEVTSKSTEVEVESFEAVNLENEHLDSRIGLKDESESRVDEPSVRREDVLGSCEEERSEAKEREEEPLEEERAPQERDLSPKRDAEVDEVKRTEEEPPMETGAELQSDHKLSKLEEGGGAEVEQERREEDEEKNDYGKEVKSVVPPRPRPPAILKPPVTPRKTSLEASPRKSVPVVAPRAKSPALAVSYPEELNPFAEDEEDESKDTSRNESKETSNPFGSEEEDEEEVTLRKKERPPRPSKPPQRPLTHLGLGASPSSPVDRRRHIPASPSLNPFWDDGEEPEDDLKATQTTPQKPPVPKPRTVL